jgi:hypothetical protein
MKIYDQQREENWRNQGYCSCNICSRFGDAFDSVWKAIKKPTGRSEIRRFIQNATRQNETEARNNLKALIDTGTRVERRGGRMVVEVQANMS